MEYKTITVNVTTGETTESIVPMTAEEITKAQEEQAYVDAHAYIAKRASEYPPITDYIDGVVKGDQAQIDKYIADCLAVKQRFPKGVA
jgi:hypothetical protein